mgnify:CR=1 FL=1
MAADFLRFYIGTYTGGESQGIYLSSLDLKTGTLASPTLVAETENPSFVAIHPSGKFLYAVNEVGNYQGKPAGSVSAFSIAHNGKLTLLNERSTQGGAPCHLVVDKAGKTVLVANYSGGSVISYPIDKDGQLGKARSFIQHVGASVDRSRQQEPHAHSINLDPENRFAVVADLGLDKVLVYRFYPGSGTLSAQPIHEAPVAPGAGPRHFVFHPNGQTGYVINELGSTISAFDYDADTGELTSTQSLSTLPSDFEGRSFTAEVCITPNGRFVYGSNRGHDSLAVFQVGSSNEPLHLIEIESTGGKTPRNFIVDPSGQYVLAENQNSDSILVFKIDQKTGALAPTPHQIKVPSPVCVRFLDQP